MKVQGRIIEDSIVYPWDGKSAVSYTNMAMDMRERMLAKLEAMQRAGQVVGPSGKWRLFGRRAQR